MKQVLLALLIAALSAFELILLVLLYISLFVPPQGGGEFRGINQVGDLLLALTIWAPLTFVIVLILVVKYESPKNRRAFRNFAWGLFATVAIVPIVSMFTSNRTITQWALNINPIVLAVWSAVVIWRRCTQVEEDSVQAGA